MSEEEARPTKVYKVTVMIVDSDELGADGITEVLEHTKYPNWCMSPVVMDTEVREVDWSDDHPLNMGGQDAAFAELFNAEILDAECTPRVEMEGSRSWAVIMSDGMVRLYSLDAGPVEITPADAHQLSEWIGEQLGESK